MLPSNLNDAVSAARDGELGLIEQVKIGDLLVSAMTSLQDPVDLNVTRKPIAENFAMTDAAVDVPLEIYMEICLANPDYSVESGVTAALTGSVESLTQTWRDKKKALYQMMKDRELVKVVTHHEIYTNMLIQSINPLHDVNSNFDAFFCGVSLMQIKLVSSKASGGLKDQAKTNAGNRNG